MTLKFCMIITAVARSSCPEVFLRKGVLKICSKFTGEHPYRIVISIKLLSNFIEITFQHGCSPVNLLHIFRTPFLKDTSGRLLLHSDVSVCVCVCINLRLNINDNVNFYKLKVECMFNLEFKNKLRISKMFLQINLYSLIR